MLLLGDMLLENKKLHIQETCSTDVPEHLSRTKYHGPLFPNTTERWVADHLMGRTETWPSAKREQNSLPKQNRAGRFTSVHCWSWHAGFPAGKPDAMLGRWLPKDVYFHHWACHPEKRGQRWRAFFMSFLFFLKTDLSFLKVQIANGDSYRNHTPLMRLWVTL